MDRLWNNSVGESGCQQLFNNAGTEHSMFKLFGKAIAMEVFISWQSQINGLLRCDWKQGAPSTAPCFSSERLTLLRNSKRLYKILTSKCDHWKYLKTGVFKYVLYFGNSQGFVSLWSITLVNLWHLCYPCGARKLLSCDVCGTHTVFKQYGKCLKSSSKLFVLTAYHPRRFHDAAFFLNHKLFKP